MSAVLRPTHPINPDQGGHWRQLAACRHTDPELFFPVSASGLCLDQVGRAKAVCAGCRVRRQCLVFALGTRQEHGVWAGMSEQELRERHGKQKEHAGSPKENLMPAKDLQTASPNGGWCCERDV
jgi:WhiB family redox-sensing transcriptional regulator